MLLRQMQYFVRVVENNSFTEAAEECYISQSAISQQIKVLEKDLGITLLIRKNRKFILTPAGEYFYRQSKLLLDEVERLRLETIHIASNENSKLRIGYLNSYKGQELQYAIGIFSEEYPDIDIEITSGNHEELYNLLRSDKMDLILNDQRRVFSHEYDNIYLYTCLCYAEISSRSQLSNLKTITLEELKRVPCIIIASENQRSNEQDYYQHTLGFRGNFLFADSVDEGRLLVAGNKGFMPIEELESLSIVGAAVHRIPLFAGDSQLKREYYAFAKKDKCNPYILPFAKVLKEVFSQLKKFTY